MEEGRKEIKGKGREGGREGGRLIFFSKAVVFHSSTPVDSQAVHSSLKSKMVESRRWKPNQTNGNLQEEEEDQGRKRKRGGILSWTMTQPLPHGEGTCGGQVLRDGRKEQESIHGTQLGQGQGPSCSGGLNQQFCKCWRMKSVCSLEICVPADKEHVLLPCQATSCANRLTNLIHPQSFRSTACLCTHSGGTLGGNHEVGIAWRGKQRKSSLFAEIPPAN
ncbi:hypothetical protein E2320_007219 [Naja naja]|nr:hypothetical protein E2320_007219 [Naja naja]